MFGFFKNKDKKAGICSPLKGKLIAIQKVNDPTFAEEILGKGFAIVPAIGRVVAPVDGLINLVFETKHAISMTSKEGTEILIHVGLDTVNLRGEHFQTFVTAEQSVKKGDLLLEFDMEAIKNAGYDITTPVVICNPDQFVGINIIEEKDVDMNEEVMQLIVS